MNATRAQPTAPLTIDDFDAYVGDLTGGKKPFPWQRALARKVMAEGWDAVDAITVPTGCGKTMVLAVHVFCLAATAHLAVTNPKRPPLRLFFVVDRRVVVDDSSRLAARIVERLNATDRPDVVRRVAEALHSIGGSQILAAVTLRGGLPDDDTWMLEPHQPALVVSTVDQVGSKLLFRAYRASDRAAPIHAGLVGHSSVVVLDEAHLSRPFLETIEQAQQRELRDRVRVVVMSATPPPGAQKPHGLDQVDDVNDPVLRVRLNARKTARLVPVASCGYPDRDREALVTALVREARNALDRRDADSLNVIGVMVNTVARARAAFRLLQSTLGTRAHVLLLTGRVRPFDRDNLLGEWLRFIAADPERPAPLDGKPIILVSTQTLEAGADVDLDHLITDSAPLDCLRQRFGRLDRLGRRHQAGQATAGAIVHVIPPKKNARPKGLENAWDDLIYGEATAKTWDQLGRWSKEGRKARGQNSESVDFGLLAMTDQIAKFTRGDMTTLSVLCAPVTHAPLLFPAHLDAFACTTLHPGADPDPSVFLHGPRSGPPDVYVVWRDWPGADFTGLDPADRTRWADWEQNAAEELRFLPPGSGEMLSVPIGAAKAWLKARSVAPDIADLEGTAAFDITGRRGRDDSPGRPAIIGTPGNWRLGFADRRGTLDGVRPGDTIVVPCGYGGADAFGWNPTELTALPEDVSLACSLRYRQRPAAYVPHENLVRDDDGEIDISASRHAATDSGIEETARWMADARRYERPANFGGGVFLIARRTTAHDAHEVTLTDRNSPDDLTLIGKEVTLKTHSLGVAQRAKVFAERLGFDDALTSDLHLAGLLHDLGKADERFQLQLHCGNEIALALATQRGLLLAKSRQEADDVRLARAAPSRWPAGLRHEYLSVQLLLANPSAWMSLAKDSQLVLWLVGTHHGQGRPWWPDFTDAEPYNVALCAEWLEGSPTFSITGTDRTRLDLRDLSLGWSDLFTHLNRKYGWWRLVTLEAVLRLADHRQSQSERG